MPEPPVPASPQPTFRLGPWTADPATRRLSRGRHMVALSPKAAELLMLLAEAAPRPVSRDEAMEKIWPGVFVGDESLTHLVAELRRAFGQNGRHGGPVETIQKAGYRLTLLPEGLRPAPPGGGDANVIDAQLALAEARRLRERNGIGALAEALRLCREAVAMAPRHAPVLAEYAMAAADCALFSQSERPDLADALAAAGTARRLRPDLACGHGAAGMVLDAMGLPERAAEAFGRALACDPADADAHHLMARMFYAAGDMRRAAIAAAEAARLRPADYCAPYLAAGAFAALGDRPRAGAAAREALGRLRARRRIDATEQRADNILGSLLARAGKRQAALAELARYEGAGGLVTYYNAAAYAAAGETGLALERLEENVDTGFRNFRWIAHDPALAPLRRERAFRRLAGQAR